MSTHQTLNDLPMHPSVCTRPRGHEGPCNGFPRVCEDNRPCWALRSLTALPETRRPIYTGLRTLEAAQQRIADLEAENTRLATRLNELISITSTGH